MAKKPFEPGRDLYRELRRAKADATRNPTFGIGTLALFSPVLPVGAGGLIQENERTHCRAFEKSRTAV